MIRKLLVIIAVLFLVPAVASEIDYIGQTSLDQSYATRVGLNNNVPYEVPAKKDELEEVSFKNEMEARLARDIRAYLGSNRFIVSVEAHIDRKRTVVKEPIEKAKSALPVMPAELDLSPSTFELPPTSNRDSSNSSNDNEIVHLPGLPISGRRFDEEEAEQIEILKIQINRLETQRKQALDYVTKLRQEVVSEIQQMKEKTLGFRSVISQLSVTLVLDNNLGDEQVEFLRNLVTRKVRLDELRGDTLRIVRTEFKKIASEGAKGEDISDSQLTNKNGESDASEPVEENLTWWEENQLSLLGAMLIAALLYLFYKMGKAAGPQPNNKDDNYPVGSPANQFTAQNYPPAITGIQSAAPVNDSVKNKKIIQELRQEIVTLGLGQPEYFQGVISSQIQQGQIDTVAVLLQLLGKGLFHSICSQTTNEQFDKLDDCLRQNSFEEEQLLEQLKLLHGVLIKGLSRERQTIRPFGFLDKLNDSQIAFLLQEEDMRVKALVISQLQSERAANMIQRMPEEDQTAVAVELGQFETIPTSAFRDVADRLAQKALNVPSFENVQADGLTMLMQMLDRMDTSEESRLLKKLKLDKPETFYRLRQVYYTFSDIERTPVRLLSNELREIDRGVLAKAICNTSDEFKKHLLSGLPDKLSAAVNEELKLLESETSTSDTDTARRQLVQKIRGVIKAGKFNMDELEPRVG